jgi:DNA (cytosine-5)-methyltransferase 1
MKSLHLFAGAGGGLLADLILGHEPVAAVEWDPYCCQVLRERAAEGWFPGLQVFEGDVRMFPASDWKGRVDCIHAGFPCQDISNAGQRSGVGEGTRSGLYREVLRCADEVRPRFIFMENVSAILSNGLGTVLGDLAARGYDAEWLCLRASDVGAPHQRDRWWCLAYAMLTGKRRDEREEKIKVNVITDPREIRFDARWTKQPLQRSWASGETRLADAGHEQPPKRNETEEGQQPDGRRASRREPAPCGDAADAITADSDGAGRTEPPRGQFGSVSATDGEPAGRESGGNSPEGEQRDWRNASLPVGGVVDGVADHLVRRGWWEEEPYIGRVTKGEENRVAKLKALGNGQVPLQSATAFTILMGQFQAPRTKTGHDLVGLASGVPARGR